MGRQLRVLVVDDSKMWADCCVAKLNKQGFGAWAKYETTAALRFIQEEPSVDIIFCDIKMPYKDASEVETDEGGFMVWEKARDCLPQAKVVMVTAYNDLAYAEKVEWYKGDYFSKSGIMDVDAENILNKARGLKERLETPTKANPFIAESGAEPTHPIFGRERNTYGKRELEFLLEQFDQAINGRLSKFLVSGMWGSGKSVLFRRYRKTLAYRDCRCAYYEIPRTISGSQPNKAAAILLSGLFDGFSTGHNRFKRFIKFIKKFALKVKTPIVEASAEADFGTSPDPSVGELLFEGIQSMVDDVTDENRVAVLLLEDIHHLEPVEDLIGSLLYTMQRFTDKQIVFGTSLRTDDDFNPFLSNDNKKNIARFFGTNKLSLPSFTNEEVWKLARQTLSESQTDFSQKLCSSVFNYTGGHPYSTQLLFHHLYECAKSGGIDENKFETALKNCVVDLASFFNDLYANLEETEKSILKIIAKLKNAVTVREIQHQLVDDDLARLAGDVETVCLQLERENIVKRCDRGKFDMKIGLHREYVLYRF